MRAMQCRQLGGPETLVLAQVTEPAPGPGQIVIDVRSAGVNFPDGLIVAGTYQTKPELPFVPGCEVGGVISAVGDGVTELAVGTRVSAFCGIGGYAERISVSVEMAFPVPDEMSFDEAAVFPVVYGTSYHALVDRAGLTAGETLLVLGASGGVGLTAVQIGKALGARVIAAASSAEKLELCLENGADHVINYSSEDLRARLTEIAGGAGVDVVYDPVGGPAAQTSLRQLAWAGRYLTVGYASGDIPRVGMNRVLLQEGALLGVLWGAWAHRNPVTNAENMATLFQWYRDGKLRPHISRHFDLAAAGAALDAVMNRRALGKIVLRVEDSQ